MKYSFATLKYLGEREFKFEWKELNKIDISGTGTIMFYDKTRGVLHFISYPSINYKYRNLVYRRIIHKEHTTKHKLKCTFDISMTKNDRKKDRKDEDIPKITPLYWWLMIIATTTGKIVGNFISRDLGLGYKTGSN